MDWFKAVSQPARILSKKDKNLIKTQVRRKWYHLTAVGKSRATAMRKSEWNWRIEILLVALALGTLGGAIAAGRLRFLFRW